MRIGKIASSAEYRMNEQFQNCFFLEPNFGFRNWKKSSNSNLDNSENFQFGKFKRLPITKIRIIFNSENSKNIRFEIFRKSPITKIQKIRNLENYKISKILQISKIVKFLNLFNFEKYQIFKISNIINHHIFSYKNKNLIRKYKNRITRLSFFLY